MREIKFRAWDIEQKVMRDNPDPQIIQAVIFGNDYNGRVKLIQYTGLKDKNGKEIYEGDILEYNKCSTYIVKTINRFESTKFGIEGYPRLDAYQIVGNIYENPELVK